MQQQLTDSLVERGVIRTPSVEAAFRSVPRHLFVPDATPDRAYSDQVIATKFDPDSGRPISSSSQPAMMAIMLEQLALAPGQRVLEIGAGTGFNAALMAHIVGAGGSVTTVDLDADLVAGARAGLHRAGYTQVQVIQADGMRGYAPGAPYDRIVLTVAAEDITPVWREQLAPDGRILLPLIVHDAQTAALFAPDGDGFRSESSMPCMFMPLRGDFAAGGAYRPLQVAAGLPALVDARVDVAPETLLALLGGPYHDRATRLTTSELRLRMFRTWLGLHQPGGCILYRTPDAAVTGIPPLLHHDDGRTGSWGLLDPQVQGLVLVMRPPQDSIPDDGDATAPFPLWLRGFGRAATGIMQDFARAYRAWHKADEPGLGDATLRLVPQDATIRPAAGEIVLPLHWHTLILNW